MIDHPAFTGSDLLLVVRRPSRALHWRDSDNQPPARAVEATIYTITGRTCTAIELEQRGCHPLLDVLPEQIAIGGDAFAQPSPLRRLLELLAEEARVEGKACEPVLQTLTAALFAMVVRYHIATWDAPDGILGALTDSRLQPALSAIWANPARPWHLKELAGLASMSRSAFARHFRAVLGTSPYAYLLRWRMMRADTLLRAGANYSVARVANGLGYSTEAAFRRAFKRFFGCGPGAVRRRPHLPQGFNVTTRMSE